MVDWPISYDDIEPYYTAVEKMIGRRRNRRQHQGRARRGRKSVRGLSQRGLSHAAAAHGGPQQCLSRRPARRWATIPIRCRRASTRSRYDGRPACTYCGFNAFFGCHIDAKSTVDLTFVRRALATGNLEIRTQSRVLRVTTNDKGHASGVDYIDAEGTLQPPRRAHRGACRLHVRERAAPAPVAKRQVARTASPTDTARSGNTSRPSSCRAPSASCPGTRSTASPAPRRRAC